MRHPGEVLTRTQLIEHVWDFAYEGDSNVVDVYVRYLRKKVDRPFGRDSIETVRGAGYRLRAGARLMRLRTRVTLVSAVLMAVVLAATGVFVYLRLQADLRRSMDTRFDPGPTRSSWSGAHGVLLRGATGRRVRATASPRRIDRGILERRFAGGILRSGWGPGADILRTRSASRSTTRSFPPGSSRCRSRTVTCSWSGRRSTTRSRRWRDWRRLLRSEGRSP